MLKLDNLYFDVQTYYTASSKIITFTQKNKVTTDPNNPDTDGDGVNDGIEVNLGCSPINTNSDIDRISDFAEINTYHTDPTLADTDYDRIMDYDEINVFQTNPNNPDSDGDGKNDVQEMCARLDSNGYVKAPLIWWFEAETVKTQGSTIVSPDYEASANTNSQYMAITYGTDTSLIDYNMPGTLDSGTYQLYVRAGRSVYNEVQDPIHVDVLLLVGQNYNSIKSRDFTPISIDQTHLKYRYYSLDPFNIPDQGQIKIKITCLSTSKVLIDKFFLVKISVDNSNWQIKSRQFTDPNDPDTDGDGKLDGTEVQWNQDITSPKALAAWFEAENIPNTIGPIYDQSTNDWARDRISSNGRYLLLWKLTISDFGNYLAPGNYMVGFKMLNPHKTAVQPQIFVMGDDYSSVTSMPLVKPNIYDWYYTGPILIQSGSIHNAYIEATYTPDALNQYYCYVDSVVIISQNSVNSGSWSLDQDIDSDRVCDQAEASDGTSAQKADTDGDCFLDGNNLLDAYGVSYWGEGSIGSNPTDYNSPGIFVLYPGQYITMPTYFQYYPLGSKYTDASIGTSKYEGWEKYGTYTFATAANSDFLTFRRDYNDYFILQAPPDPNLGCSITKADPSQSTVSVNGLFSGWYYPGLFIVKIPKDCTIGKYTITISKVGWSASIDLFVIFEIPSVSTSTDDRIALTSAGMYAYLYDGKHTGTGWDAWDIGTGHSDGRDDISVFFVTAFDISSGNPPVEDQPGYYQDPVDGVRFDNYQYTKQVLDKAIFFAKGQLNTWDASKKITSNIITIRSFAAGNPYANMNTFIGGSSIYGDNGAECSAMSCAATSLLRSIGIPARPAVITNYNVWYDHCVEMWTIDPNTQKAAWYYSVPWNDRNLGPYPRSDGGYGPDWWSARINMLTAGPNYNIHHIDLIEEDPIKEGFWKLYGEPHLTCQVNDVNEYFTLDSGHAASGKGSFNTHLLNWVLIENQEYFYEPQANGGGYAGPDPPPLAYWDPDADD